MRQQGRGEERQTPPFPTRQTKAKKASEQRGRLKEEDIQREGGEEEERRRRWGRWRERAREREMVSQKVIKKQVEEKGRVVAPHCQRRLMDKRACESMLGGQTHCQTHRHQTHEGKEEDEREEFIESTFGRVLLL